MIIQPTFLRPGPGCAPYSKVDVRSGALERRTHGSFPIGLISYWARF